MPNGLKWPETVTKMNRTDQLMDTEREAVEQLSNDPRGRVDWYASSGVLDSSASHQGI